MDLKQEFDLLIKSIKANGLKTGKRLKNSDIAKRLGYNTDYFNTLTGKSGKVTKAHVDSVKAVFKDELAPIVSMPGNPMNADTALLLGFLSDYIEYKAVKEGLPYKVVKAQIAKRAERFLEGLESWSLDDNS